MSYKNEKHRVTSTSYPEESKMVILSGKNEIISAGDNISVGVIWNNLIGANMESEHQHKIYLKQISFEVFECNEISLQVDGKIVSTVKLSFHPPKT